MLLVLACMGMPVARGEDGPDTDTKVLEAKETRQDSLGDPLPLGAVMRLGSLRMRHQSPVKAVAISPDGKLIASVGDYSARLWSADTGEEVRRFSLPLGPNFHLRVLSFSPDGKCLVTEFRDKAEEAQSWYASHLRLWDVQTGKVLGDLDSPGGSFAFTADGKTLVAGRDRRVQVWDVAKRQKIREIKIEGGGIRFIALSPDCKRVATVGMGFPKLPRFGCRVDVFDVETGKLLWSAPATEDRLISGIAYSPDGKTIAVSTQGKPVLLLDAQTGKKQGDLGTGAYAMAYSHDGSLVALATADKMVITLWETATGKEVRRLIGHGSFIDDLVFSRDDKTLVSGGRDSSVRLWEVSTGKERLHFPGHQFQLFGMSYLPNGRSLVSHGSDHTVRFWDIAKGKEVRRLTLTPVSQLTSIHHFADGDHSSYEPHFRTLDVSSDGTSVAVCDPRRAIHLWDVASGKDTELCKGWDVEEAVFSPKGNRLLSAGDLQGRIRIWDVATKQLLKTWSAERPRGVIFMGDGQKLLIMECHLVMEKGRANYKYVYALVEPESGKKLEEWQFPLPDADSYAMAMGPEGLRLAFSANEQLPRKKEWTSSVFVWDFRSGLLRPGMKGHQGRAHGVAFSPDWKLVASAGGDDKTIRVWEIATGQEVLCLQGHQAGVNSVSFSPDGERLASGSKDTTILLWDLYDSGRTRLKEAGNDLRPLWAELAADDGKKSYLAMTALVLAREKAVTLLSKELRPMPEDTMRKTTEQLLEQLKDKKFEKREAAGRDLRAQGWEAAPAIRHALTNAPNIDFRRSLETLIADLGKFKPTAEARRLHRAIRVLESIGSAEARQLLGNLSHGAEWAEQTREARAALARLQQRRSEK